MAQNSITTHPTIAQLLAILILILASGRSFCASAYKMPADQLLAMSNKQLCDMGQTHWDKNELDSALICFNIVANRADKIQTKEDLIFVISANTIIANIYTSKFYDFEQAIQYLLKAERYAKENTSNLHLANIYELMASFDIMKTNIQHDFAFNNEAFELHRKAFFLYLKERNNHVTFPLINMITLAHGLHRLDLVQNEIRSFLALNPSDTIETCKYAKHLCQAVLYAQQQQYDSTLYELSQLEKSLDMPEHASHNFRLVAHQNLFYAYRDMGNKAMALRELDLMQRISEEKGIKDVTIEVLFLKTNYYAALGNVTMAERYDLLYHKAKDEFMAEAKVAKVDEEKVLFKLNDANNEIKELSYKQRIQQTELIAIAVVAVLLLMLLVISWMSYRRMQEKNQTLYQHNMQLIANEDRLRQLQQAEQQAASESTAKYRRSNMEGEEISLVMGKVDRVMESSPEVFSTDFSLEQLAELTGESRIRLSQAINQVPGRTFYSILNGYRVREACRRMNDKEQYGGLTIEAIAQSVGFKNRSSFVAIFKRITGLTPSAYLKQPKAPDSPNS